MSIWNGVITEMPRRVARAMAIVMLSITCGWQTAAAQVVVVEEETAGTVEEAATLASTDDSAAAWSPALVRPREVDGARGYSRQSSDAFTDPDQRLSLEAKYSFELDLADLPKLGNLVRGHSTAGTWTITCSDAAKLGPLAELLPMEVKPVEAVAGVELEWLDYESGKPPRLLVAMVAPDDAAEATVEVVRGDTKAAEFVATKVEASRSIPSVELPPGCLPGGRLDVWDRPASLGSRANFYGRVIAVLKLIEGRYAVDFLGDALHSDSDCRLWLGGADHAWGRPVGIRFVEIPILKEGDRIVPTGVLGVIFENAAGERRAMGFDFPLCSAPTLVQLRKLSQGLGGSGGKSSPPPDLAKLVGEDVVDELSRRLVDGEYR